MGLLECKLSLTCPDGQVKLITAATPGEAALIPIAAVKKESFKDLGELPAKSARRAPKLTAKPHSVLQRSPSSCTKGPVMFWL